MNYNEFFSNLTLGKLKDFITQGQIEWLFAKLTVQGASTVPKL